MLLYAQPANQRHDRQKPAESSWDWLSCGLYVIDLGHVSGFVPDNIH